MSERDGDGRYGVVSIAEPGEVKWLTPPGLQVEGALDIDGPRRALVFEATRDGLHRETLRVSLDGGDAKPIAHVDGGSAYPTFDEGLHDVFVSQDVSLTGPRRQVVRSTDGNVLREIPSIAERPKLPNLELTMAGPDGARVAIVRPRAYVAGARYAIIDSAYAGPHVQLVSDDAQDRQYVVAQWMADATGAIVVIMDVKGTPGRGRAWERAILGKLGDVPLDGHVAVLQALAASHPEIDASRIGVYGWSFGGYFSALAALRRPDVFRAAVAIAPPADWRDYDTAYTERYLGLPQDDAAAYDAASLLTYARKPPPEREASLMVIHGTADDNVYFFNSLKLADALAKSGRRFRFLPFTGQTHQIASPDSLEAVWMQAAVALRAGLAR